MCISPARIDQTDLLFQLAHLTRRWRRVLDVKVQTAGLTDAMWRPLLHLYLRGDGIRQKDLAASVGMAGPSLVRILDRLVSEGLIDRRRSPSDRRAKLLCLTPAGQQAVARIHHNVKSLESELLSGFDEAETSQMAEFVRRLEASVNRLHGWDLR